MSEVITSSVNPKIKRLIRLREKRARERDGVILVEGYHEISRYLETKPNVCEAYLCPELMEDKTLLRQLDGSVKSYEVTKTVFMKLAYGHRMEGLLLVGEKPAQSISDVPKNKNGLYVAIERIEKPGNLGAILRSCDGAGVDAVFVCDPKVDLYNPNVIRSSLGTVFSRCVLSVSSEEAIEFLKNNNIVILAASPDSKEEYTKMDLKSDICLVVGTEDTGLTDLWLKSAAKQLSIPMLGKADSLNVSVSTAIILYEILRQRNT